MSTVRTTASRGFSLIEMIVSLGLFSIVITITVGALLSLIASNDQIRGEQSVMTNLAFALDSMTREIRTGSYYYCGTDPADFATQESFATTTENCDPIDGGIGISFLEGGSSITGDSSDSRIAYYFDADEGKIMRQIGDSIRQSMVGSDILINDMRVWVTGSNTLSNSNPSFSESDQPVVTILIEAQESATTLPIFIQTSVTQRTLDL